jgi:anaerobic C4-dicarboxylate transporter DcuB
VDVIVIVGQFLVVVAAIVLGVRTGGVGLGLWGVVGVAVLTFAFRLQPGPPPIEAILIILSVITAAAAMQAAGGVEFLVSVAERLIRSDPSHVTFIAPLTAFAFTVGAGTGNIYYPLIPVIYEVAYGNKIRPERPLAVSSVASQLAIACSPVSAATAAMLTLVEPLGFDLVPLLAVVLPASLIGIMVAAVVQNHIGAPLEEDEEYQRRLAAGEVVPIDAAAALEKGLPRKASMSAYTFLGGVAVIILLGIFPTLRPQFPGGTAGALVPLSTGAVIQIVMAVVATVIIVALSVKPADVVKAPTFTSGMVALIALFGIAWLAQTFIAANEAAIIATLGDAVKVVPLSFAIVLFIAAALTTSQSSTTRAIVPIGVSLGMPAWAMVAMWPSVIGIYFLPANGSQLTAVSIDETGSTKIGKYVLNHSFMLPMLISWVVSVAVGLLISWTFFSGH